MAGAEIIVDDEVLFGPYCVVVSSNHSRQNGSFRYGASRVAPIHIESGVWVAAHVTVTAGSVIGSGALVAAGAVVRGGIGQGETVLEQPSAQTNPDSGPLSPEGGV